MFLDTQSKRSRRRLTASDAIDRFANVLKWATTKTADKRKKDDDFDMESGKKFRKASVSKTTVPYLDITAVLVVGLLVAGAVYTVIHGLTSTLARPAPVIQMFEPNDEDITTVEQLLTLSKNGEKEQLQYTLLHVAEQNCKEHFPFTMTEDASLAFHGHMLQLVDFMAGGGDLKTLAEGHVVVGDDGSIYSLDGNSQHESQQYSTCNLLNAFVWYNHHKQVLHTKSDDTEEWAETYGSWEKKHTTITGDIDRDAQVLMSQLNTGNPIDFEFNFNDAMKAHCGHIVARLGNDKLLNFITQGSAVFEMLKTGTVKANNKQIVVTADGRMKMHDENQVLHGDVMTCPLLDKALHHQAKSMDEQIDDMLLASVNGDMFGMEVALDGLIQEHCQAAKVNMDDYALRSFHGHMIDFANSVAHKKAVGNNDFVALRTGELVHREETRRAGVSPSTFLSCPLINAISAKGNHAQETKQDKDQFSDNNSHYQEEREALQTNTFAMNPARDIDILFQHLEYNQLHDFNGYLWDLLFAFHGDVVRAMTPAAKDTLHHRMAHLVSAVHDHTLQEIVGKLMFSKVEGELFFGDDMDMHEHSDMVTSPLLDALSLIHDHQMSVVDEALADYHAESHDDAALARDVEVLFHHVEANDWYAVAVNAQAAVQKFCGKTVKALANDDARRVFDSEVLYILEHIGLHLQAFPGDTHMFVEGNGRLIVADTKPDDAFTCPVLDEIIAVGKAVTQHSSKSEAALKTDAETLRNHLAHEHQVHASEGLKHDVTYLINAAKGDEVDELVADVRDSLKTHCPQISTGLKYQAATAFQGHVLQMLKHVSSGHSFDNVVSDAVVVKSSGHIVAQAEADSEGLKTVACPLVLELLSR